MKDLAHIVGFELTFKLGQTFRSCVFFLSLPLDSLVHSAILTTLLHGGNSALQQQPPPPSHPHVLHFSQRAFLWPFINLGLQLCQAIGCVSARSQLSPSQVINPLPVGQDDYVCHTWIELGRTLCALSHHNRVWISEARKEGAVSKQHSNEAEVKYGTNFHTFVKIQRIVNLKIPAWVGKRTSCAIQLQV